MGTSKDRTKLIGSPRTEKSKEAGFSKEIEYFPEENSSEKSLPEGAEIR
jgi:hypothetical protein